MCTRSEVDMADHIKEQCLPISMLEDVWQWECKNSPKYPVPPLRPSTDYCYQGMPTSCHVDENLWRFTPRVGRNKAPKTLLCHDMKGGYLGDRFVNGTHNSEEYRFFHWAGVDTFVYFSHHLITIPPPGWVTAAHVHGVKILGTFITEWVDGEKICKEILKSPENINHFVKKLVHISEHYGFDGWLVNIENKVSGEVGDVKDLVCLVDQLRNEMHTAKPHSLVIWYDSVTCPEGDLRWQNELNSMNREFFDHSDGIFLNYTWNEENIITSLSSAKDRSYDVYVGIDVFGRNCYGGGGFNTCKALEVARKYELSVAIFAPGWVHEQNDTKNFTELEYLFWNTLRPYLFLHGPSALPFQTSFCQGAGLKMYSNGKEVSSAPWFNLSLQQYQPTTGSCRLFHSEESKMGASMEVPGCMETFMHDAFSGGSSLLLSVPKSDSTDSEDVHYREKMLVIQRIFICSFYCHEPFLVSVATKTLGEHVEVSILLKVKSLKEEYSSILLQENPETAIKLSIDTKVLPLDASKTKSLGDEYNALNTLTYSADGAIGGNWIMRHYFVNRPQVTILEIGAVMHQLGSVLVGFLSVQEVKPQN